MDSNCTDTPNWIVIVVPVMLGFGALILIIIFLVRLKKRTVIDPQKLIRQQTSSRTYPFINKIDYNKKRSECLTI